MAVELEGGCRVAGAKEGTPRRDGDLLIWPHFDSALSLRVLQLDGEATLRNARHEETLYVVEGSGTANGAEVGRDTGIYLPPEEALVLTGRMTLVSSLTLGVPLVPRESAGPGREEGATLEVTFRAPHTRPDPALSRGNSDSNIVRLAAQEIKKTGDRWYCELFRGQTTQFVGAIPPGRAPDHFHLYEEVIHILSGSGVMWAGEMSAPIAPGSCIFLPRKQRHCVENRGDGELRLLGVFYPAGSPAVRYSA